MDKTRWLSLNKPQQIGNIGSEIARADYWRGKGDTANVRKALERALELLDLTLDDRSWKAGLKEICRLREVVADWFCGGGYYDIPHKLLENWCVSFVTNA